MFTKADLLSHISHPKNVCLVGFAFAQNSVTVWLSQQQLRITLRLQIHRHFNSIWISLQFLPEKNVQTENSGAQFESSQSGNPHDLLHHVNLVDANGQRFVIQIRTHQMCVNKRYHQLLCQKSVSERTRKTCQSTYDAYANVRDSRMWMISVAANEIWIWLFQYDDDDSCLHCIRRLHCEWRRTRAQGVAMIISSEQWTRHDNQNWIAICIVLFARLMATLKQ